MRRLACWVLICLGFAPLRAWADPVQDLVRQGWTADDLKDVPELIREDVEATLRQPTLVRHFARYRVDADLETEMWLADHPPIASAVGRELGVFPFIVTESWPRTYRLEGSGLSRGEMRVLIREDDRALIFASARVRIPWASTVRAHAVACVRWWPHASGTHMEHDIFMYGRLRSRTARWFAFITRPFSGPMITRRLYGLINGARQAAEAVSQDPEAWAARMEERPDRGPADHLAWDDLIAMRRPG